MEVSKDNHTILRRCKRLNLERKNSLPIPVDLIIEILSRLPARSIALCRCVSKLWRYMLGLPYFTESFLTRSLSQPKILFASHGKGELLFFSTPQLHVGDENSSRELDHLMRIPYDEQSCEMRGPIHGLVYLLYNRKATERKDIVQKICNPSTGQVITLPKVKSRRTLRLKSMFGYDPIEKQFKVLFMTWSCRRQVVVFEEHQVLTLGTKKMSWKMIECGLPHFSQDKEICINGVLYYIATGMSDDRNIIACFDVRSEKFSFINTVEASNNIYYYASLVNCNGKLGAVYLHHPNMQLWILDDVGKQEWSMHTHAALPSLSKSVNENGWFRFVGVTDTNEFVFSPKHTPNDGPLHIVYYNTESKRIVRVRIQARVKVLNPCSTSLYTVLNHVEDVTLMEVF